LLGQAYKLKEDFYDIWDTSQSRGEAIARYEEWSSKIPADVQPQFEQLTKAINNWHVEVFNYFDHKVTNAFTESKNNIIRAVNREGRGYSFAVIRAKILFGVRHVVHSQAKPQVRDSGNGAMGRVSVGLPVVNGTGNAFFKDFGTDISTLSRLIDDGHFFTDSTLSS
jgi:hypothetical protein